MFARKLEALDHINPSSFNINDEKSFKELVVWLEDQKIRHYKIEDRKLLKTIDDQNWIHAFKKYVGSLNCPLNPNDRPAVIDWLLGLAVQFEYSDNVDKYKKETGENVKSRQTVVPKVVNTNPLDALDFTSPDFRDGVNQLADMLKITRHPNHLITLKAVSQMVKQRLSQDALQNPKDYAQQGKPFPLFDSTFGFETGDNVLNNAGKALQLLYINDLRNLQTQVNECIVACQNITADPKTDTRIGKIGVDVRRR